MSNSDFIRQLPRDHHERDANGTLLQRLRIDLPLLLLLLIVTGAGLVVLFSASDSSSAMLARQGRYLLIGYFLMFAVAQVNIERLKRLAPFAYAGGVLMLLGVMFFGSGAKGAQRWLDLGGFRFQPSEVMKLVVPMTLAWYYAVRPLPPRFKYVAIGLVILMVPSLLIARQPDLGTAIIIGSSGIFVLFLAGIGWHIIAIGFGLIAAAAYPIWVYLLHDYQRGRILTMLNPELDKLGAGWNIIQSQTAIGSGGIEGKGWLLGTQSHLDFLPESHTDFIVAVLAEEFGLRGVLMLLLLYVLLIMRGAWIGITAKHSFGRLLAGSITLTFFVYVFVNMGMVSGLLPVVGVPLPLVSQGGTSMVTLLVGFGMLMSIRADERFIHQ
ncbi:MAG TPA: rod shape-determining protein RodA [Spongiibacteraceae bacterium]|nr:rod shape-determining protein RodA [Spongiibacteraceae bacterium]HCS28250.1 rod shape-determining protein RodA [Spongiibacteraceae bacterium]